MEINSFMLFQEVDNQAIDNLFKNPIVQVGFLRSTPHSLTLFQFVMARSPELERFCRPLISNENGKKGIFCPKVCDWQIVE